MMASVRDVLAILNGESYRFFYPPFSDEELEPLVARMKEEVRDDDDIQDILNEWLKTADPLKLRRTGRKILDRISYNRMWLDQMSESNILWRKEAGIS